MSSGGDHGGGLAALIAKAKAQGVPIKEADPKKLEHMCGGANHQGVVAVAAVKEYASLEEIFARAEERGEPLFLVICDGLEDPHNLGAVIRTAECAGAHGVVIPKRRSVGLTYAVGKASAGAVETPAGGPGAERGRPVGGPEGPGGVDLHRGPWTAAPGARQTLPARRRWSSARRAAA